MKIRSIAPLFLCGLAFVGCGGGESGDEAAIAEMLVVSAKSDNPADCTKFLTMHYLEQSTKLEGEAAVEACEEQAVDPELEDPSKVVVSQVNVNGGSATATVSLTGSTFGGQTVRLALVERDGQWKLHELLGFVDLDAERLVTEMGRQLMREMTSPMEVEAGACIVARLEEMSAQELEELMLEVGSDRMFDLAETCVSRSNAL